MRRLLLALLFLLPQLAAAAASVEVLESFPSGTSVVIVLLAAVPVLIIGSIAWPIRAVRRWRGGWRTAAMVPLGVIGFVVLRIIFGTATDPTSHNLWPFELLIAGAVSTGAMLVFVLLRWFQGVKE